jgi:3-oxosteroid 1-dehydrogenase
VTGARATRLGLENGRIAFVQLESPSGTYEVHARRGVVLATGGFEWDTTLVRSFLRGPMHYPASVPTNTGDGLRMAMRVGAQLGNMREAWWMPVTKLPGVERYGQQQVALILRERALPGTIMINRRGVRFVNEATNYNAMGGAFHQLDPVSFEYSNLPCWVVFDARLMERYGFLGRSPGGTMPDWVPSAPTIMGLAEQVGIASALVGTIERWNAMVACGRDLEFNRGESAYDGFNGDMTQYPGRASTLGRIGCPPFYAIQIESSTLGTNGGPRTNEHSEVLDVDGNPIPGLFAAGNVMASPTGMVYGGAGGTLGPALVFGYIAGCRAACH